MGDTFTQLYVHIIFSVENREKLLGEEIRQEVYAYIGGIIKNQGQKPIIINGTSDHIHILMGLKPDKAISDLVREIKSNSTNFINEKRLTLTKFRWQTGFGAFTCCHSHLTGIADYIKNQEEHHRKRTFTEEYKEFLDEYQIQYNEKYVF